jgi:leucyl aminopeptidase
MTEEEVLQTKEECGKSHGGFFDITDHMSLNPSDRFDKLLKNQKFPSQPTHQDYVKSLFSKLSTTSLKEFNDKLTSFKTRYYQTDNGKQAAEWIFQEFEKIKGDRKDISVRFFSHNWKQPSVIATIKGKDGGVHADEIVIIGAHEDSINLRNVNDAPGSDDDGSGTSTVLEIFRVLVESGFVPDRTIEFHTYAAEEVGLRGSQDIASQYQTLGLPVYSQLQLDMTFYTGNNEPKIGIITDYVNSELTEFLRKLIDNYSDIKWVNDKCGYGCSDHASWTKAGYPSCFPFETTFKTSNPYIHSTKDTISNLDLNHGLQFARIGLGYVIELGLIN